MLIKTLNGLKNNLHYYVYLISTIVLFVINYTRVNGTGAQWAFCNELIGVIIFAFILLRTGIKEFMKIPFGACLLLWAIMAVPLFHFFSTGTDYDMQLVGKYVNLLLCAILLLRIVLRITKEKSFSLEHNSISIIWIVMLSLCIISKNKSVWPAWMLIMFGTFFFESIDSNEFGSMFNGIVDGIIVSFFLFESFALLHFPYDQVRYCACFSNSDCSAKFFTVCYVAFLCKLFHLKRLHKSRWMQIICFLFAAAMWGFCFFTMTRSGYIGMGLTTCGYLLINKSSIKIDKKGAFKKAVLFVAVIVVSIPIIYGAIRYIPALRHHPIFLTGYSEDRVHSWDPIDSEKYVSFGKVLEKSFNRFKTRRVVDLRMDFTDKIEASSAEETIKASVEEESSARIAIPAEISADGEKVLKYLDGTNPGSDELHPVYIKLNYNNYFERFLGFRKYLYSYYFRKSGLWGNEAEYPSVVIFLNETYTSAHSSTLDFTVRYGYIAGAFFIALQILSLVLPLKEIEIENDNKKDCLALCLLISSAFVGWGIFYSTLFMGEIMDSLYWISLLPLMNSFTTRKQLADSSVRV